MSIFVTVGTTEFQELIDKVLTKEFLNHIIRNHFNEIIIQYGSSKIDVQKLEKNLHCKPEKHNSILNIQYKALSIKLFDYDKSLSSYEQSADLVLSHGGSGTIFEVLYLKKPIIAVINGSLMDNHQEELVLALERRKLLWGCKEICSIESVLDKLIKEKENRNYLEEPKTNLFAQVIKNDLKIK